jgi:hypothetical protein
MQLVPHQIPNRQGGTARLPALISENINLVLVQFSVSTVLCGSNLTVRHIEKDQCSSQNVSKISFSFTSSKK